MMPVSERLKYLSSYFMMKTGTDRLKKRHNNRLSFKITPYYKSNSGHFKYV